ncbi:MAG TPA: hypothetical protein VEU76_01850 [Candidatus Udaeobacter sp.]|nr:hypothetical protein [Candidatus Udaeobacter sp.]
MKPAVAVLSGLVMVACATTPVASTSPNAASAAPSGSPGAASPSTTASPRPTTSPSPTAPQASLRFAVVEGLSPSGAEANTVAIVGLDGYAKAKAQFTPRQRPYIGNAAVPLQPVAQVIGSAVYYIDGYGTVRALRVGVQPQTVASFSTQPAQYETWFAVTPDGGSAIAGVLQYPAIGTAPSPCEGLTCMPPLVGPWQFSLVRATGGSPPTVLQQIQSPNHPDIPAGNWHPTFPVAWVAGGPVAMVPVSIGTQNAWWGGPLYLLDSAGKQVRQVGGADCASDIVAGGQFIPCTSGTYVVTVRDLSGDILWTTQIEGFNALSLRVSPDGQGVTDGTKVERRGSGLITMPVGFNVEGWLDDSAVVGWQQSSDGLHPGNLSWINVGDPATVHDLGFKGDFVGTLGS